MLRITVRKKLVGPQGALALDVDLSVAAGSVVTLFGPSGAGKSSILRMVAGLMTPDEGVITVNGRPWFDSAARINIPARQRHIGFVFQEYSLFPNMTVRENLEFALATKAQAPRIEALLEATGMTDLGHQRPHRLSGGQKQRVALVRALLRDPQVFLLDEPLAALDADMRLRLQNEILTLHRTAPIPTLFVTHDLPEVFKLSGEVFVLSGGRVSRAGAPAEMFGGRHVSGKFKMAGRIIGVAKDQGLNILTVLAGGSQVKIIATDAEMHGLSVGSPIVVSSKAFNPLVFPAES